MPAALLLLVAAAMVPAATVPASAQTPPVAPAAAPAAAPPAAPSPALPAPQPSATVPVQAASSHPAPAPSPLGDPAGGAQATRAQAISVQAGTGVLLRLPQAAATLISAQPDIARVQPASPTSLFLMGVSPGRTTVVATNEAGSAIIQYDVTVTPGVRQGGSGSAEAAPAGMVTPGTARAIEAAIAQTVSGATRVRARAAGGAVVLSGTVPTALAAQQAEAVARGYIGEKATLTDEMVVLGAMQVNVRVRIAEINRQITRQLGFNWQALGNGPGWRFGMLTGAATGGAISPLLPLGLAPLANGVPTPNQLGSGFTSGNGMWDVNNVIDALAADQLITILAEPNLTALSGETASFLAGGEFPIPVAGNGTNGTVTITVEFKTFGVSLAVVPTVLSPTRLNLRIRPEVSQLSQNGAVSVPIGNGGTLTIPALTVRRAETTVELGSGQSFAIAGLLQHASADGTNALPYIGEVPVLGALFRSNDFQRGESELVIIVTPYLVNPAPGPEALHLPTDGFRPATDLDRILLGRQMSAAAPGGAAPGGGASGGQPLDAGFILK
ncbi:MAG: type II and III secretion system protein family protein [Proteobacteria bacterium]|nr:type II and III secretion system protein family protein [Pseudomonadota bacterium]